MTTDKIKSKIGEAATNIADNSRLAWLATVRGTVRAWAAIARTQVGWFIGHYKYLLILGATLYAMTFSEDIFKYGGTFLWFAVQVVWTMIGALGLRALLNKNTSAPYVRHGQYDDDWAGLDPKDRVQETNKQFWVYLLVAAIIAMGMTGCGKAPEKGQKVQKAPEEGGARQKAVVAAPAPEPTPVVRVAKAEKAPPLEPSRALFPEDVEINPAWAIRLDQVALGISRDRARYEAVASDGRGGGCPWYVIGALHEREASRSFLCHIHNGDRLTQKTYRVPKGRIPNVPPPYTWEVSAKDALYVVDEMGGKWSPANSLDRIERYNGLGYRRKGLPSPYLWSGTRKYKAGKYVQDGVYSATAIDKQPGVVAICIRMKERGLL